MSDINFSKLTWENLPARTTALSATNLNRIEKGIDDSVNGVNSNSHSIAELQTRISQIANGSPTPVSTVAEMTDESAVYLYTGSESGYTAGNWYYYNGTAWTSGGTYGGAVTDTTLSISGAPADAKAVGDALAEKADADDVESLTGDVDDLKEDLNQVKETYLGSQGTVPNNIDHFLDAGWYRITPSYQTATLPANLTGVTHTLIVIAPASPLTAGLQILVSASCVIYSRYVFSGSTAPSTWKQCATLADVNDLRNFIDSQIEMFLSLTTSSIVTPTYTTGKFIDSSGNIQTNADMQISDAIELKAGNTITLYARGYLQSVSMVSECDAAGNYISGKVRSIDSAYHIYTYTPLYDCYVIVSGYTQDMKVYLTEKEEYFDDIENLLNLSEVYSPTDITWSDGYISNNGIEYSDTGAACKKSSLIDVKAGFTIRVNAHYSGTSVAIISKYNTGGTYTPLVISDTNINTYEYTATEDMQVCVSGRAKADYISRSVIIYRNTKNAPSLDFVNLSMFETFGVVGDSFASGALMTDASTGSAHYNLSWGQVLARNLGTECINFSEGGLTTKTWLTSAKGLPLLLSSNAQDIYYLALGINDAYHLSNAPVVPLGTIDDIKADYTQNPDSFYGNYGRIIDQIKAKAPKAKLIMFTVATYSNATYSSPNKTSISNAIKEIANHYSIPVIEQDADWFFRSDFYLNNMVFSHPTAPLYSGMANAFKRMIETAIHDNYSYFADYGY